LRQWKTETKVGMFVLVAVGIFVFMLIQLGIFRPGLNKYSPYDINFSDVSGISIKAFVKIAGVKVGWIDKITLQSDGTYARIRIMVKNRYHIHQDAYAIIRQEGVLGSRYLEIIPGNPELPLLPAGASFVANGRKQPSVETLLCECQDIVTNIRTVSQTLGQVFGGQERAHKIELLVDNLTRASQHIAEFSQTLNSTEFVPKLQSTINNLAQRLDGEILPALHDGIQQVSSVFARDFDRVSNKLEKTADMVEQLVKQAQEGITNVSSISKKIDSGQGILGKLVNDNQVYEDVRSVAQTFRDSIDRINQIGIDVDAHGESMIKSDKEYCSQANKGYVTMRIKTMPGWFYSLGIVNSEKGWPTRIYTCESYYDDDGKAVDPSTIVLDNGDIRVTPRINHVSIKRNDTRFDVQIGKEFFDQLTLRAGTIEGTFGVGADWQLPINSSVFRWLTTLEVFDCYGQNRFLCDRRPHLKWINRLYFFDNIYLTFGADDFISRYTKNAFFGAGLCFTDDDLKHVASKMGVFGSSS